MDKAIPIITTIAGVLIGALFTRWLLRAKPKTLIDRISILTEYPDEKSPADMNADLKKSLDGYGSPKDTGAEKLDLTEAASERRYITTLREVKCNLENDARFMLPLFRDVAERFHEQIVAKRLPAAYEIFAPESVGLWWFLATAHIRNEVGAAATEATFDKGRTRKHPVIDSEMPGLGRAKSVALKGKHNIRLPYSFTQEHEEELEKLASKVADAFSYEHEAALLEIAESIIKQCEHQREHAEHLLPSVHGELHPYRRLIVEGMITNSGGSPYSLSNNAKMIIGMQGQPYAGEGRKVTRMVDDLEIDLELGVRAADGGDVRRDTEEGTHWMDLEFMEDNVDFSSPAIIQAGQSARFVCRSKLPFEKIGNYAQILQAFEGKERRCYAIFGVLTSRGGVDPLYSRNIAFCDLVQSQELRRRSHREWPGGRIANDQS